MKKLRKQSGRFALFSRETEEIYSLLRNPGYEEIKEDFSGLD